MAYIEEFTIHGLAGHPEPVHRILDRHVNIFWGLNGSGKTSLLKILHSSLRNHVAILRRVPFESAEVIFWSTDDEVRLKRTIQLDQIDFDDETDYDESGTQLQPVGDGLWREVPAGSIVRTNAWTTEVLDGEFARRSPRVAHSHRSAQNQPYPHSYLPISRLSQVQQRHTYGGPRVVDDAYLDEDFVDQVRRRWQAYNSDSLATIRSIQQQGLASILALLFGGKYGGDPIDADSVSGEQAYELVSDFLSEQRISPRFGRTAFLDRYAEQSDLRAVVANIQDVRRDVALALKPQREFQDVIERLYSGNKRLTFGAHPSGSMLRVEINGSSIPMQSLSSGEKQLLRLSLEVLAADRGIVMIDEPELSMHVDWQQVLVASMQRINSHCQLLLATHSPEVMADVDDAHVFEL